MKSFINREGKSRKYLEANGRTDGQSALVVWGGENLKN
jgi:hypothetical protein